MYLDGKLLPPKTLNLHKPKAITKTKVKNAVGVNEIQDEKI